MPSRPRSPTSSAYPSAGWTSRAPTPTPTPRDWDAPVLCGYETVAGDLALSLDVWTPHAPATPDARTARDAATAPDAPTAPGAPTAPNEPTAALRLAVLSGTTVLYPATDLRNPSAYWAATPDGLVTRARVEESDDPAEPRLTVEAVEARVPHLPGARVQLLPEVYRSEPIELPTTGADPLGVTPT
ncbi:hypothetical protein [Streptomyces sp. NPDC046712]|uniref:hypothetical protein n=1 Tax=Streptomyces sp. NPDC046712 TaxID=3154802 RepID=UPI0033BFD0C7